MTVAIAEGTRLLTGAGAVVEAMRQIDPDVVPVYPITPQTPMIEGFAKLVADGLAGGEVINVESEHSAMSAAVGSALAGARTMTATSSQGLALMAEVVYLACGLRAPIVTAIGNRALSGPINIHCDHSDSMLVRDSGVVQLFAESAQEAYDLMVMAPRIAEHPDVMLPVFVCQDGFTLTHSAEGVLPLPDDAVEEFVGPYEITRPLLDTHSPSTQGAFSMPDYYYELKYQQVEANEAALGVLDRVAYEYGQLSGRRYPTIERYETDDAERVLVCLGSTAGTIKDVVDVMRSEGERVGLLRIGAFRPFPAKLVWDALSHVPHVVVLDRAVSPGAKPPLLTDMASALYGSQATLTSCVYGLGGRDLDPGGVRQALALAGTGLDRIHYLGLRS